MNQWSKGCWTRFNLKAHAWNLKKLLDGIGPQWDSRIRAIIKERALSSVGFRALNSGDWLLLDVSSVLRNEGPCHFPTKTHSDDSSYTSPANPPLNLCIEYSRTQFEPFVRPPKASLSDVGFLNQNLRDQSKLVLMRREHNRPIPQKSF